MLNPGLRQSAPFNSDQMVKATRLPATAHSDADGVPSSEGLLRSGLFLNGFTALGLDKIVRDSVNEWV